jgi:methylamine dehydrogenase accessory protein MauD
LARRALGVLKDEVIVMVFVLLGSTIALWLAVLLLGFLLWGALRSQGLLAWRLEQLEATTPSRLGRSGLKPGQQAPDFTLATTEGGEVSLRDLAGRRVLLVFLRPGCGPCQDLVPELNKLASQQDDLQVLAINHATPPDARAWVDETSARFPVLVQEDWTVSKRYEVFATPFAFLIDARGVIASKGIVSQRHHLGYVLSTAAQQTQPQETQRCDDAGSASRDGEPVFAE